MRPSLHPSFKRQMNPLRRLLPLAAALAAAAPWALAQEAPDGQQQQLSTVEQQLKSSQDSQDKIAQDIDQAIKEQEDVSARLVAISQKIQAGEAAISESEEELLKLGKEQVTLLASLGEKQDQLSELLAGLQRLEHNPPPALAGEP